MRIRKEKTETHYEIQIRLPEDDGPQTLRKEEDKNKAIELAKMYGEGLDQGRNDIEVVLVTITTTREKVWEYENDEED